MPVVESESDLRITTNGRAMGGVLWRFWGNWPRYNGIALYFIHTTFVFTCKCWCVWYVSLSCLHSLRHWTPWGRDNMAAISKTTFSSLHYFQDAYGISMKIQLECIPNGLTINMPSLVKITFCCWTGGNDIIWTNGGLISLLTHARFMQLQIIKLNEIGRVSLILIHDQHHKQYVSNYSISWENTRDLRTRMVRL